MTEEIKAATEKYIDVVLRQTEDQVGVSMVNVLVEATGHLDKLCNALLIFAGAAMTLSIGSVQFLEVTLGGGTYKVLLVLFLSSALFGFISKASRAISEMYLFIAKELVARMTAILDEFNEFEEAEINRVSDYVEIESRSPDLKRIFSSFVESVPSYMRVTIENALSNTDGNKRSTQKNAMHYAFIQLVFFALQSALVVCAIIVAVLGVE